MENNDFNLIEELTKLGVSKHSFNKNGDNILHIAVGKKDFESVDSVNLHGVSPLINAIQSEQPDMAKYLIEKMNANIENTYTGVQSPIEYALMWRYDELVKLLIEKGALNNLTYEQVSSLKQSTFELEDPSAICSELDKAYNEDNLVGDLFTAEEQF